MPHVRYLGIVLGEVGDLAALRSEPALGRFVPLGEPLPVGAQVELDGMGHVVARVEEGLQPGCWLRADGAATQVMQDMPTVREIPVQPVEAPAPVEAAPVEAAPVEAPAVEATPPAAEPAPVEENTGRRKRKNRGKTIIGR